jgi:hypothetical protein
MSRPKKARGLLMRTAFRNGAESYLGVLFRLILACTSDHEHPGRWPTSFIDRSSTA